MFRTKSQKTVYFFCLFSPCERIDILFVWKSHPIEHVSQTPAESLIFTQAISLLFYRIREVSQDSE